MVIYWDMDCLPVGTSLKKMTLFCQQLLTANHSSERAGPHEPLPTRARLLKDPVLYWIF